MGKRVDHTLLIGNKYGKLTVIDLGKTVDTCQYYICICECGNVTSVSKYSLLNGKTRSCGCLYREVDHTLNIKHGLSRSKIYKKWGHIKERCFNETYHRFSEYGGRGIVMCDEWKNDFPAFYTWAMKAGYKEGLTIERIDVNGNYCPENCTWVSPKEQYNNMRKTTLIDGNITVSEFCRLYNLPKTSVKRFYHKGLSVAQILDFYGLEMRV